MATKTETAVEAGMSYGTLFEVGKTSGAAPTKSPTDPPDEVLAVRLAAREARTQLEPAVPFKGRQRLFRVPQELLSRAA